MAIKIDGISVKREKKVMYFLLAIDPLTFMSFFNEFFISIKMIQKKIINKTTFDNRRYCRLDSFKSIKLLFINVKKVKKPTDNVTIKIIAMNILSFINRNINLKSYKISYKFNYE